MSVGVGQYFISFNPQKLIDLGSQITLMQLRVPLGVSQQVFLFSLGFPVQPTNHLVGHTPGVLTDSTADIAVALSLSAARRFSECISAVKTGTSARSLTTNVCASEQAKYWLLGEWATWSPFWLTSPFDVTGGCFQIVVLFFILNSKIGRAHV